MLDEVGTVVAPETAVVETTPAVETHAPPTTEETPAGEETPTPEATAGEGDEPLPGEPEEEAISTDARVLDGKTRETIASLKKMAQSSTDPVQQKALAGAAKALADAHFGRKAYEKEFPTVQEARQAKATLESLGGEEGITELQNEVTDYRAEIEQFSRGDRALLDQLHKANPESTVKMLGHGLDILSESGNVEALDRLLLPSMVSRMEQTGLYATVLKAAEFVKEGKGQEAYDQLGLIGKWLGDVKKAAAGLATEKTKAPDPREKEFTEREQRLQKQETENYERSIGNTVTELNNATLETHLKPFFKQVGFVGPEHAKGRREFTQAVLSKVWAAMKEDKVFQRNWKNKISKGDAKVAAEFGAAKFAELAPEVFRRHRNTMYPNLAKAAATNGKPNGAPPAKQPEKKVTPITDSSKAIRVAEVPQPNEVDWAKTTDILWTRGQFYKPNDSKLYSYH